MFAVIYSVRTGRIRWHTSAGLKDVSHVQPGAGCAIQIYPDAQYGDLPTLQAQLSADTGLVPANDTYAIVDSALLAQVLTPNVVGSIVADPEGCGDAVPGHTLIAHPTASMGWTYHALTQTFVAPIVATSLKAVR